MYDPLQLAFYVLALLYRLCWLIIFSVVWFLNLRFFHLPYFSAFFLRRLRVSRYSSTSPSESSPKESEHDSVVVYPDSTNHSSGALPTYRMSMCYHCGLRITRQNRRVSIRFLCTLRKMICCGHSFNLQYLNHLSRHPPGTYLGILLLE